METTVKTLVGPTVTGPVQDPLAVLSLDNQQCMHKEGVQSKHAPVCKKECNNTMKRPMETTKLSLFVRRESHFILCKEK